MRDRTTKWKDGGLGSAESIQNYTFGQNMNFLVCFGGKSLQNRTFLSLFLALLDLGGHYGHKMCVFPQEYELFPY